jgi:hypothetical protein
LFVLVASFGRRFLTAGKRRTKMEVATVELAALEAASPQSDNPAVIELADLQLALVGGGVGEVVLA